MTNKSFQDIIPADDSKRRTIRNIPLREKKENKIDELLVETAEFRAKKRVPPETNAKKPLPPIPPKTSSSRRAMWTIAFICIMALLGSLLFFFKKAEVDITLKVEQIPVDIIASSTPDTAWATGTLQYKLMTVEKDGSIPLPSNGTPANVQKKATGTIAIYNNYGPTSQILIANTRFQTSGGLIFRLDKTVTVPPSPGSVNADITADQPGANYNLADQDFTIPGFQGTPKYKGFYARSVTPTTGGFSGLAASVSDADLQKAQLELQSSLASGIQQEFLSEVPPSYVFFKEGIKVNYTSDVQSGASGTSSLEGKAIAVGMVFDNSEITDLISSQLSKTYQFDNLGSLDLSILSDSASSTTPGFVNSQPLLIELKGTLTTGNSFDKAALQKALAGKSKSQLQEILSMYPEIISADATLHPVWMTNFPNDPDKIGINVVKQQ